MDKNKCKYVGIDDRTPAGYKPKIKIKAEYVKNKKIAESYGTYVDNPQRGWIYWMTIYNKDGEIYFTSNDFSNNIKWKYSGGKFIKIVS